ncbi:MAG: prephenate dehydrogenase [Candidatus Nanopelagicales bacterium]|nr:prephenate dehydrogenase [Candidatus Nanopelagicales bacterium]
MPEESDRPQVHVIGFGLIGASIAMSLQRQGYVVSGADTNLEHEELARHLGVNTPDNPRDVGIVFVCVPPTQAASVMAHASLEFPGATITDVTSVKNTVMQRAVALGCDPDRLVGAHPMAGREQSGPRSARADLFEDRVWVITPSVSSEPERMQMLHGVIGDMGSTWVQMSAEHHDRVVATVSHAPQILSSVLAGELLNHDPEDLAISGAALTDMTRIAASDPQLWREILLTNSAEVLLVVDSLISTLSHVRNALADGDSGAISDMLTRGNTGRSSVPGKHGGTPVTFEAVNVMVSDKPGALAELFTAAGGLRVNLEDVRIEHVMGRPSGIVQLFVRQGEAETLEAGLEELGFSTRGRA